MGTTTTTTPADTTGSNQPAPAERSPEGLVWTVEGFGRFWAAPDAGVAAAAVTDDVVGHWAGLDEPVRGRQDYVACIEALLEARTWFGSLDSSFVVAESSRRRSD